jgi:phosphate transport system permease protein
MNNRAKSGPGGNGRTESKRALEVVRKGLGKRYARERRFRFYGALAICLSLLFLATVFFTIFSTGYTAFVQTYVQISVYLDPEEIDRDDIAAANFLKLVKNSIRSEFPEVQSRLGKRRLAALVSSGASYRLRRMVEENPDLIGETLDLWVLADDDVDMLMKGHISKETEESGRRLTDEQIAWVEDLEKQGKIDLRFNTSFFTTGDSREPEQAGIRGALYGSFFTLLVTLALSFPIGVAAAIYLEEFAPKNRFTDLIEVNINNLAAVPSIVFGLLGLAVFLGWMNLPRSAPLVGGLVLTLMTLPTIIIAARASLKSVPPSIREAALGVGASPMQAMTHHVLPLALPGILTGTIIGMAQALGETAPLLMIGMMAFIVDVPHGFTDPASVLPVQIYLWSDSPERGFMEKTSAAIMVLLTFLVAMNATAVLLRKRFERRW